MILYFLTLFYSHAVLFSRFIILLDIMFSLNSKHLLSFFYDKIEPFCNCVIKTLRTICSRMNRDFTKQIIQNLIKKISNDIS